jgi:polysaccharide biosynthesis protein PslL
MINRNSTIDLAKGIGIFLVVLGHNPIVLNESDELFRIIFSFHMPLFFFLSGIFLRETDQLKPFVLSRASSLLKPYFVILVAMGLLKLFLAIVQGNAGIYHAYYFLGLVYGTGRTIDSEPMWFLPHLFISLVFSLVFLKKIKLIKNSKLLPASVATVFLLVGIYFIGAFWYPQPINSNPNPVDIVDKLPGLPWSIDLILITSSFIIFGYLLREKVKSMTFRLPRFLLAITIFAFSHYYFDETINLSLRVYGNPFISTLQASLGIYIIISLASLIQERSVFRKPLMYLGSGTLFILIFHNSFQNKAFEALSKVVLNNYFTGIFSLVVGVALPLILWEITKRQAFLARLLLSNKAYLALMK